MQEWVTTTVMIVSFAMLIVNAFMLIYGLIQKGKEPTDKIQTRIDNLERLVDSKFKEYDTHFDKDLHRIEDLEEGSIVTIETLQAILRHSIDGNNIEGLKEADESISKYLLYRGKRRV